jgi:hypothetical protein
LELTGLLNSLLAAIPLPALHIDVSLPLLTHPCPIPAPASTTAPCPQAVNELPPDAKRARIQQLHLAATVRPGAASAAYPNTDGQFGGGPSYKHTYQGWDSFHYGQQQQQGQQGGYGEQGQGGEQGGEDDATYDEDEVAQWAAGEAWQAKQAGGYYPGSFTGGDDYLRYLRPEDQWAQAQAAGAAAAAAAAAAGPGGVAPTAATTTQQQRQQQQQRQEHGQHEQQAADAVAQEALGLIGGYGSGSDSECSGSEGGAS